MTVSGFVNQRVLIIDSDGSNQESLFRALSGECSPRGHAELDLALGSEASSLPSPSLTLLVDVVQGSEDGLRRVKQAREADRPFAVAFLAVLEWPGALVTEVATRLLASDAEIQLVVCLGGDPMREKEGLLPLVGNHRVTLLFMPSDSLQPLCLTTSLLEKWRLTHEVNERCAREAEENKDTQQVATIIEGCLRELELAHEELLNHAAELTDRLHQRTNELSGTRDLAMFALAQLADSRDPETGEHLLRMRAYAQLLAEYLSEQGPYQAEIDEAFLDEFYRSTPLHDIGKVGIPDPILLKPGPLTDQEFEVMKRHTVIGAEALRKAANQSNFGSFLGMATAIARSHHERYDGSGYPDALRGKAIPLAARITSLADVFDALTSSRVYKEAMDPLEARDLIEEQAERQFDPAIVDAFLVCFDEFLRVKAAIDGEVDQAEQPSVLVRQPQPLVTPLPGPPL